MKQIILIGILLLTALLSAASLSIATEQTADYLSALQNGEEVDYRSLAKEDNLPYEVASSWESTPQYIYDLDFVLTKQTAEELKNTLKSLYQSGYDVSVRQHGGFDVEMKIQATYNYLNAEMPLVAEKEMMSSELRLRATDIISQIDFFSGKIEFSHVNVEETKCARCSDGRLKLKSVDVVFRRVMDGAIVLSDFVTVTFDAVTLDVTNIRISWKEYKKREELKNSSFLISRMSDKASTVMSGFEQNKTGFSTIDSECTDNKIVVDGAAKVWKRAQCGGKNVLLPGILVAFKVELNDCKNKSAEETLSLSKVYPLMESPECRKDEFDIVM